MHRPTMKTETRPQRGQHGQARRDRSLDDGVNFAVYSETASALWVSLYDEFDNEIGRFELDGHEDNIHSRR